MFYLKMLLMSFLVIATLQGGTSFIIQNVIDLKEESTYSPSVSAKPSLPLLSGEPNSLPPGKPILPTAVSGEPRFQSLPPASGNPSLFSVPAYTTILPPPEPLIIPSSSRLSPSSAKSSFLPPSTVDGDPSRNLPSLGKFGLPSRLLISKTSLSRRLSPSSGEQSSTPSPENFGSSSIVPPSEVPSFSTFFAQPNASPPQPSGESSSSSLSEETSSLQNLLPSGESRLLSEKLGPLSLESSSEKPSSLTFEDPSPHLHHYEDGNLQQQQQENLNVHVHRHYHENLTLHIHRH